MKKDHVIKKYFNQAEKLKMENQDYFRQVKFLLNFFLREDLTKKGDVTSDILVGAKQTAAARIVAKQDGVLAGLQEVVWLLRSHGVEFQVKAKDGQAIKKDQTVLILRGNFKKILRLERTLLNILQRMSGIASLTARLAKLAGKNVLICPTRKTQWELLDKRAVICGHGGTHRLGLHDFVLIKENHLKKNKLTNKLINQLTNKFWEVEVENKKQALQMARLNPWAIMFDDFKPAQIRAAIEQVKKINSNIIFEASGGINESNIRAYAQSGVDIISLGSLTHSVEALDIGLYVI